MTDLTREHDASGLFCSYQLILSLAALVAWSGCHSTALRPAQIPPEFRSAAPNRSSQTLDFASAASPGSGHSLIAPGDLLKITVAAGRSDEKVTPIQSRVADDGMANLPVIGPVPVAGMEAFDASQSITQLAVQRGMYRHPHVTVEIESKAVNRITVLGAVAEPGVHEIPRGSSDLVSALAASGGLTKEAGTEIEIVRQPRFGVLADQSPQTSDGPTDSGEIQLAAYQQIDKNRPAAQTFNGNRRGWSAPQTVRFDLAGKRPFNAIDFRLSDRDIVRVIPRKKEVIYIAGLVKNPGQFDLPLEQDLHLLDAIALAGGMSSTVADKVLVIRRAANQPEPIVIKASIAQAKKHGRENLRLLAGDTVTIEQTPVTVIVDTFAKFFRLSFGVASNTVF